MRPVQPASIIRLVAQGLILLAGLSSSPRVVGEEVVPSAAAMAASRRDIWGEAAVRQPGGPSYEFFKPLLPPLRYVNTAFRHYPIVLSGPGAAVKARWISNGSAVNARASKPPMWREVGFPVQFFVDNGNEPFGGDLTRLDGPRWAEGHLPIVQIAYTQGKTTYEQEAFAAVRGGLSDRGGVPLRFGIRGDPGHLVARLDMAGGVTANDGAVRDAQGNGLVLFDAGWQWDAEQKQLRAALVSGRPAVLTILTRPLPPPLPEANAASYEQERTACVEAWKGILDRGVKIDVAEPLVNDVWRAHVIGNFAIAVGDRMNYSAGNAYDHLYEGECGDATRALMLYGHLEDARRMVGPLLDFQRQATRFHVAGHKLQLLAHYYWVTRDAAYLLSKEAVWKPVVEFIVSSRTSNGLLPKDNYAGDIPQQVHALSSNASCWRGLRDMAVVLDDLGERERAAVLAREAAAFRQAILDAVAKSERRDVQPPFIPNALLGAEPIPDPLTATRLGSYYDLMAPYIIGSGVLGLGSERETWMMEYLRQHGGIAMGMIRSMPHQGEFAGQPGVNVLYGLRYMLAQLRRDERDLALTGFYGHLAHGMTRDTFIGGEGSRFFHGDPFGRSFYLPPNSASNAMFLTTLRYLLVQDWDLDDDGKPETLRLLYGTPGRWLNDGAVIRVERAPTMFGELSLRAESHVQRGEVLVTVQPPPRRPGQMLLRPALPPGWRIAGATLGDTALRVQADGAVDVSSQTAPFTVRFGVIVAPR